MGKKTVKIKLLCNNVLNGAAIMRAVTEIAPELGFELGEGGLSVELQNGDGLMIEKLGNDVKIVYDAIPSLMRALSLVCENIGKNKYSKKEKLKVNVLAPMIDQSRNAVMTVDSLKSFIRKVVLMGYNAIQLYTEDTFELEGYPYFGQFRGRITDSEIIELRDYCEIFGMEVVPCIQTLAHLKQMFHWNFFGPYRDLDDILLVGSDQVYELIDKMLEHYSKLLPCRRINIGMDEAYLLGRGNYVKRFGYENRSEIMKKHLKRVAQICEKYNYKPMMWSDMFFRMRSVGGVYTSEGMIVDDEMRAMLPENVTLVYWDYANRDEAYYDDMFGKHADFRKSFNFAGGVRSWNGVIPQNTYAAEAARNAMKASIKFKTGEVYVTMWGDDGQTCSRFSAFSTLQVYAETAYGAKNDDKSVARRMKTCTGADYNDFLSVEKIADYPGREDFGEKVCYTWRQMFWQDVLMGQFDAELRMTAEECAEHFAGYTEAMKKCRKRDQKNGGKYSYIFDTYAKLGSALEIKAGLGVRLKDAYDSKNNAEIAKIADVDIPKLIKRVEELHKALRFQWYSENKPEGFDTQDIRFGGLIMRLKSTQETLHSYLDGKIERINELEYPRLKWSTKDVYPNENAWRSMVTVSIL